MWSALLSESPHGIPHHWAATLSVASAAEVYAGLIRSLPTLSACLGAYRHSWLTQPHFSTSPIQCGQTVSPVWSLSPMGEPCGRSTSQLSLVSVGKCTLLGSTMPHTAHQDLGGHTQTLLLCPTMKCCPMFIHRGAL